MQHVVQGPEILLVFPIFDYDQDMFRFFFRETEQLPLVQLRTRRHEKISLCCLSSFIVGMQIHYYYA